VDAAWAARCSHPRAPTGSRRRERATDDTAAAEAAWRSALAIDPANAEAMFYLGKLARERGESTEAIRIYEDALAYHPRDAQL
jgi:cytochrome c-type biogenesis protein CcmH/NrfG